MTFCLIDRIDRIEPEGRMVATKAYSRSEPLWGCEHGEGQAMPPPLLLESVAQAGTWLCMHRSDRTRRALLLGLGEVTWAGPVQPGSALQIEIEIETDNDEGAVMNGTVTCAGTTVLQARGLMCALVPADQLDTEDGSRQTLERLYTPAVTR